MPSLNRQILIAACLGVLIGWAIGLLPADQDARSGVLYVSTLVGSIFIGMLKMVLVPGQSGVDDDLGLLRHHRFPGHAGRVDRSEYFQARC